MHKLGHLVLRVLVIPFLLVVCSLAQAQQTIRVGVYNFAPVVFIDEQKQAKGLFVDVLDRIARQEDWKIDYVPGSWGECLSRLENGEIDLLMSIVASEERQKKFDFTEQHLFLDWGVVYRRPGATIETVFDLQGKTVGALRGSIYTSEFRKLLDQFGIKAKFVEKDEYAEVLRAVGAGELDAGINANVAGLRLEGAYPVERTSILFAPLKLRFAVKRGQQRVLLERLDGHFKALYADKNSFYHDLSKKWLGADTGGLRTPVWVWWSATGLLGAIVLLLSFSLLLKGQVKRKTAEALASERRFRAIFDEAPLGIALIDSLDGQIQAVNPVFARIAGRTVEEMFCIDWMSITHPDDIQEDLDQMARLNAGEIDGFRMEKRYLHLDGTAVWINMTIALLSVGDKSRPRHLCMIEDITARISAAAQIRRAGEELRQLNETLEARVRERTEQLEDANSQLTALTEDLARSNLELEQFAYVASHDLQEPLRMVIGFVQLLEKRLAGRLGAEEIEFMSFAVDGALRMQRLIQDILAYSRVGTRSTVPAPTESGEAVREALLVLRDKVSASDAQVEVGILPRVSADHTQLVQLFQNLIANAIKFCRQGKPLVRIAAHREPGFWRFSITDNGIGVAAEYHERIFGIFQRLHTREEYAGTGIGLAICKRIVQRHGGSIGVTPDPGGGSTFWFTIPEEQGT